MKLVLTAALVLGALNVAAKEYTETRTKPTGRQYITALGTCQNDGGGGYYSSSQPSMQLRYTACREIRAVNVHVEGPILSWNKKVTEIPGTESVYWELANDHQNFSDYIWTSEDDTADEVRQKMARAYESISRHCADAYNQLHGQLANGQTTPCGPK